MSWVIVTGANGGIGEVTVHQLIKNGSVFAAVHSNPLPLSLPTGRYLPLPSRRRYQRRVRYHPPQKLRGGTRQPITGAVLAAGIAHTSRCWKPV